MKIQELIEWLERQAQEAEAHEKEWGEGYAEPAAVAYRRVIRYLEQQAERDP